MAVPNRHILHQGPVLSALGRTVYMALKQRMGGPAQPAPALPGPEVQRTSPPLPRRLVDDYIRLVGGDPRAYRDELPPHLFPQWCMPALARTLDGLPYPLLRVLNGGCRVRVQRKLSDREPLSVCARLMDIDDDGRRAVLHQRVLTGTQSVPEALVIDFYAIAPLAVNGEGTRPPRPAGEAVGGPPRREGRFASNRSSDDGATNGGGNGADQPTRERRHVPDRAREIARMRLGHDAGLAFAKLTGDFNPIHWLAPVARASGFPDVILHGFGELALAWEALHRNLFGGDVHALQSLDVKFARPLVLPHEVGAYVLGSEVFLGDAPGGPAYLTGSFTAR